MFRQELFLCGFPRQGPLTGATMTVMMTTAMTMTKMAALNREGECVWGKPML